MFSFELPVTIVSNSKLVVRTAVLTDIVLRQTETTTPFVFDMSLFVFPSGLRNVIELHSGTAYRPSQRRPSEGFNVGEKEVSSQLFRTSTASVLTSFISLVGFPDCKAFEVSKHHPVLIRYSRQYHKRSSPFPGSPTGTARRIFGSENAVG